MALRRTLSKRLFTATNRESPSPITTTTTHSLNPPPSAAEPPHLHRDSTSIGFFRSFLQQRAINNHSFPDALPTFLTLPIGDKLWEKLKSLNVAGDHRLCLDGLSPPPPAEEEGRFSVNAVDAKRVLRFV